MTEPRIAFCITCKGRAQHIKQTLPKNLADNAGYRNAVFVLVDYGSPDDLAPYLLANHKADMDSGRLVVYQLSHSGQFRMAHAKNLAHRLGILEGADILVNLDADNYTGTDFAQYLAGAMADPNRFMWACMIPGVLARGISGRIVCTKHQFLAVGGYDERFEMWGRDDKDFNERLRRLGFEAREIDVRYLNAVRHTDKMRFKEYPEAEANTYDQHPEPDECDNTVVNEGWIGIGVCRRNYSSHWVSVMPVPTRIFGIGMHKTGTYSLHCALQLLGFDSAHWHNAHWAKSVWTEMQTLGRSTALERYYALSDLPFTLLYKELDKAYPGSKFILTTRNEEKWLRSVALHWSREHNKYRGQWDTDPFTHRVHKELYGQRNFDAVVMLERYRRHNAEVREYFAGRGVLLELNLDIHDSMLPLCQFLNADIPSPDQPFPKANVTPHA